MFDVFFWSREEKNALLVDSMKVQFFLSRILRIINFVSEPFPTCWVQHKLLSWENIKKVNTLSAFKEDYNKSIAYQKKLSLSYFGSMPLEGMQSDLRDHMYVSYDF